MSGTTDEERLVALNREVAELNRRIAHLQREIGQRERDILVRHGAGVLHYVRTQVGEFMAKGLVK